MDWQEHYPVIAYPNFFSKIATKQFTLEDLYPGLKKPIPPTPQTILSKDEYHFFEVTSKETSPSPILMTKNEVRFSVTLFGNISIGCAIVLFLLQFFGIGIKPPQLTHNSILDCGFVIVAVSSIIALIVATIKWYFDLQDFKDNIGTYPERLREHERKVLSKEQEYRKLEKKIYQANAAYRKSKKEYDNKMLIFNNPIETANKKKQLIESALLECRDRIFNEDDPIAQNLGTYTPPKGATEDLFYNELVKNPNYKVLSPTRFRRTSQSWQRNDYHNERYDDDKIYEDSLEWILDEDHLNFYYPDLLLVDNVSNLIIDIEIDEPYTYVGTDCKPKPLHYLDFDVELGDCNDTGRDEFFTGTDILVVRFAEEQIVNYADDCLDLIKRIIDRVKTYDGHKPIDFPRALFRDWKDAMYVDRWTADKAMEMAVLKFREKYLHRELCKNVEIEHHTESEVVMREPATVEEPLKIDKATRIEKAREEWLEAKRLKDEYTGNDNHIIYSLSDKEVTKYLQYSNEVHLN